MPEELIRVFIGTEAKTEIARKVLECSIARRTKAKVQFTPMIGPEWEYPIEGIKVGTGFSLRRWMIPAACDWQGKAIYLDADQIVFGDIAELWHRTDGSGWNKPIAWCTYQPDKYHKHPSPQTSVMVLDCANAKGKWGFETDKMLAHLKGHPTRDAYVKFMHAEWLVPKRRREESRDDYVCFDEDHSSYANHPVELPVHWNHLNVYVPGLTKLLHFTKEDTQPWYKPDHPLAKHWKAEFQTALKLGYITREEVLAAVGKYAVREDWRATNGLHPEYLKLLPRK